MNQLGTSWGADHINQTALKKRSVCFAVSLFLALNLYGQGDVFFNNFFSTPIINFRTASGVSSGDGIEVQLYASSSGVLGTFMPVPGSIIQVGLLAPGYFDAGMVRIPASIIGPGAGVFLELRGWESAYGVTFEQAVCSPPMSGRLALSLISQQFWINSTGNPHALPPEDPVDIGHLIPEMHNAEGALLWHPTNQTVQCSGPEGAIVPYGISVIHVCGGNVAISCQPPSGSLFPLGVSTVFCTVTNVDGFGTFGHIGFVVTVEDPADLTIAYQADSVIIDWQRQTCGSYVLEQTENLNPPIEWAAVVPLTKSDATNSVTLPMTGGSRFYRFQTP